MNHQESKLRAEADSGTEDHFDVVILGGGFAGGTLALHLALHLPELSVAVIEPKPNPPRFAHKVGESSLGPQGAYLVKWLQLEQYMNESHIEKFGTRYFFGDTAGPFAERPEVGARHAVTEFPVYEYQWDRGKLEADLQTMTKQRGVTWLPYHVTDVQMGQGCDDHTVHLHNRTSGAKQTVRAQWVVDASGRRRLLHRQRHNHVAPSGRCSAAWFRVPGWIDVDDFVPTADVAWHDRVKPQHPRGIRFGRFNSTNHLCNTGYWVWLIPLPDEVMSVGIVAEEAIIPFESYNTAERALAWLATNEPLVADAVADREMLDFRVMRHYSYPATDFVSTERWALVGEALGFADPFYSPGGDMISLANLLVVETIRRERSGTLTEKTCQHLTESMRRILSLVTDSIQSIYPCLGDSRVAAAHVVWDFVSMITPMVLMIRSFNPTLYDYLGSEDAHCLLAELAELQQEMGELMQGWMQEECSQLPTGSILDHSAKLGQLTGHMWSEAWGKDLSTLIPYLLTNLQAIATDYRTRGLAWELFDAA